MSFYPDRNGRAHLWDLDHHRLELSRWVFHNPERLLLLINKLAEFGISIIPTPDNQQYETDLNVIIQKLSELTPEEIDAITGVVIDPEN